MKLWWPHSEAMIAFLMGYRDSGDPALLRIFCQVAEYTFRQVGAASQWVREEGQVLVSELPGPPSGVCLVNKKLLGRGRCGRCKQAWIGLRKITGQKIVCC